MPTAQSSQPCSTCCGACVAYERLVADWHLDPRQAIRRDPWVIGLARGRDRHRHSRRAPACPRHGERGVASTRRALHRVAAHVLGRRRYQVVGAFRTRRRPAASPLRRSATAPRRSGSNGDDADPLSREARPRSPRWRGRRSGRWPPSATPISRPTSRAGPTPRRSATPRRLSRIYVDAVSTLADWLALGWRVLDETVITLGPPRCRPPSSCGRSTSTPGPTPPSAPASASISGSRSGMKASRSPTPISVLGVRSVRATPATGTLRSGPCCGPPSSGWIARSECLSFFARGRGRSSAATRPPTGPSASEATEHPDGQGPRVARSSGRGRAGRGAVRHSVSNTIVQRSPSVHAGHAGRPRAAGTPSPAKRDPGVLDHSGQLGGGRTGDPEELVHPRARSKVPKMNGISTVWAAP